MGWRSGFGRLAEVLLSFFPVHGLAVTGLDVEVGRRFSHDGGHVPAPQQPGKLRIPGTDTRWYGSREERSGSYGYTPSYQSELNESSHHFSSSCHRVRGLSTPAIKIRGAVQRFLQRPLCSVWSTVLAGARSVSEPVGCAPVRWGKRSVG